MSEQAQVPDHQVGRLADPRRQRRRSRPTHVIAHLSDTHLTSAGVRYNRVLDSDAALRPGGRRAGGRRRRRPAAGRGGGVRRPDRHRRPDAYARLAAALGVHARVRRRPPDRRSSPPAITTSAPNSIGSCWDRRTPTDPILQVHDVNGLRIIVLDSTHPRRRSRPVDRRSPGRPPGRTRPPPPRPAASSCCTMPRCRRHPRCCPTSPSRRHRGRALSAAIGGTDVRLILAGHHHLAQSGDAGLRAGCGRRFDGHPDRSAGRRRPRTDLRERRVQPGRGLPGHHHRLGDSGRSAPTVFDLDADGCRAVIQRTRSSSQPRPAIRWAGARAVNGRHTADRVR